MGQEGLRVRSIICIENITRNVNLEEIIKTSLEMKGKKQVSNKL
jgi:hypothetical protein